MQEHHAERISLACSGEVMMKKLAAILGYSLLGAVIGACTPSTSEEPENLIMPTSIVQGEDVAIETPESSITPIPPAPTFVVPTRSPSEGSGTDPGRATPSPTEGPQLHHVAFVAEDDVLNVRSGPGVDFDVVFSLAPDASGIQAVGSGQVVLSSTWIPIVADGQSGWVNGRFLTETIEDEAFCEDDAVPALLEEFGEAVADQNDDLLAQLVHPERGLRVRHTWWNPEVILREAEAETILAGETEHDWGIEDGSGLPIAGTFAEKILPLLKDDLLSATEAACNEILHGGTAGIVRLPDGYQTISLYSFFRPGTEANGGLDWGAWVVGVEKWQGDFYISFLVHFAWEI
jgi:uncharacterized protein YraI